MALPWWQHHKHCLGYYIYYIRIMTAPRYVGGLRTGEVLSSCRCTDAREYSIISCAFNAWAYKAVEYVVTFSKMHSDYLLNVLFDMFLAVFVERRRESAFRQSYWLVLSPHANVSTLPRYFVNCNSLSLFYSFELACRWLWMKRRSTSNRLSRLCTYIRTYYLVLFCCS